MYISTIVNVLIIFFIAYFWDFSAYDFIFSNRSMRTSILAILVHKCMIFLHTICILYDILVPQTQKPWLWLYKINLFESLLTHIEKRIRKSYRNALEVNLSQHFSSSSDHYDSRKNSRLKSILSTFNYPNLSKLKWTIEFLPR